ncbi:rRNA maturation RNase YbeY [Clostridium sp. SYSU_GA19001]|uniref:rRNA maturation RNase YbeY n=1 Tax=Clostridium caldaquaticum TaxID=2940653 RepID=UPI00207724E1|nr:rRNA maturation RNase YbeY [Clostridium caldaquaticum]MCM8710413.1 rRNA maturation RNase YbeY [Clostridium caldaquaticum]
MIFIDNRQTKVTLDKETEDILTKIIDYCLKVEKVYIDYEVSVIFIDNAQIREINREYRKIDKETDVLSFPMLEYPSKKVYKDVYLNYKFDDSFFDEGRLVFGDIAISLEKAKAQSIEYGHSFLREICYLTIHSVLHLLGYDHIEEDDKIIMRKREEEILENFNINRNL